MILILFTMSVILSLYGLLFAALSFVINRREETKDFLFTCFHSVVMSVILYSIM